MTADFNIEMTFKGTKEEIKELFKILKKYHKGDEPTHILGICVKKKTECFLGYASEETIEEFLKEIKDDGIDEIEITAGGPYGKYYDLRDFPMFTEIADTCPDTNFEANINGFRGSGNEGANYVFENNILTSSYYGYDSCDMSDEYCDIIQAALPIEKFIELFEVEDEIDEDDYNDIINELLFCPEKPLAEMTFEDFCDLADCIGINGIQFEELRPKLKKLNIPDPEDFENAWAVYNTIDIYNVKTKETITNHPENKELENMIELVKRFEEIEND